MAPAVASRSGEVAVRPVARAPLGVVVVNYRSHHLLRENLDGELPEGVVVVVVDNWSTAAERRAVQALARDRGWQFVPMTDNRGFAAGVNAGVAEAFAAGCDCVVLLNPDARVPVEVLLELGRVCRAEPLTMVSPRLVDRLGGPHFHGSELDLSTGRIRGLHPARRTAQGWSLGASRVEGTGVPWLTGACLAMHRRLFTLIGGLDERYFLYWEDVDLSFRARRHGATLAVRPDLVGRHDAGGTQGARRGRAKSARYYYFNARNRLRFAARHLPRRQLLRWLASTPRVSLEILLQGGRRQLLRSPVPLLAVTAGAAAGVIHAVRTLPARPRPPAGPPAPAVVRQPVRVTVAMLTFHRADDLVAAVPLLLAQREEVTDPTTEVDVLVVDNDPAGRGAAMVRALQHPHMRAVVEPTPGIPAARNRALDECADRDVLVFIDDDERPHEGWLRHLLDTYRSTGADAVAGPVVSRFSGTLDPWVAAGAFFRRRRLPTGSPIDVAATNNLLLDMAAVRRTGARFDVRFGLVGVGEDTLFTRSMAQQGARLLWCDEAIVTDVVPAERITRSWVLLRAFSMGDVWSLTHVHLRRTAAARAAARLHAASRGALRCAAGAVRLGLGRVLRSPYHQARGLRTLVRGAGMVVGAAGVLCQPARGAGAPRAFEVARPFAGGRHRTRRPDVLGPGAR